MAREIFADTSGFYALLVKKDSRHTQASGILHAAAHARRRFVTTDYVLDETSTLLKARRHAHLLDDFFEITLSSPVCQIEWTGTDRFDAVRTFFLKHLDQAWSFTDCLSFRVMKELRLREALTTDEYFAEAGYVPLLRQ